MQPKALKASHALATLLPISFVLAGILLSPLFFACALLVFGVQIAKMNKRLGLGVAALGLVYFLLVFGYGMGKDLALRDNARQANQGTLGSP